MKLTKQEQLELFCRLIDPISKATIMYYGVKHYFISADRVVRRWVEEGRMRKLTKQELKEKGLSTKMAWYSWKED